MSEFLYWVFQGHLYQNKILIFKSSCAELSIELLVSSPTNFRLKCKNLQSLGINVYV